MYRGGWIVSWIVREEYPRQDSWTSRRARQDNVHCSALLARVQVRRKNTKRTYCIQLVYSTFVVGLHPEDAIECPGELCLSCPFAAYPELFDLQASNVVIAVNNSACPDFIGMMEGSCFSKSREGANLMLFIDWVTPEQAVPLIKGMHRVDLPCNRQAVRRSSLI